MVPISRKRRSQSQGEESATVEPTSKRRCFETSLPQSSSPEGLLIAEDANLLLFDDEPRRLLLRSVAFILEHVGFEGASQEALEALCAEVDTYAAHLLCQVTTSMLNSRRSQTTPFDFKYALARFDLPLVSIEPHLKPPISASRLRLQLESLPPEELNAETVTLLVGDELSGEQDKKTKPYIPDRFPSFPSKHTYKWTEKQSARETDPRKIREEAAKVARQGEEALRRLVKVSKAGKEKDVKRAASKDPKSKERHDLWEKAMEDLMVGRRNARFGKADVDEDCSMIVNAEKQYWRKEAPAKKKSSAQEDIRVEN